MPRASAPRRSGGGRSAGPPPPGSAPAPGGTAPPPRASRPRSRARSRPPPARAAGRAPDRRPQRGRQRAVDQRAPDHEVDVVEPVAQDRDARRHRDGGEREQAREEGDVDGRAARDRGESEPQPGERRGVGEPLQLEALHAPRAPQPHDERERGHAERRQREQVGEVGELAHPVGRRAARRHRVGEARDVAGSEGGGDRREGHAHGDEPGREPPARRDQAPVREQQQQEGGEAEEERDRRPVAQPREPAIGRQRAERGRRAHLGVGTAGDQEPEPRAEREQDPAHDVAGHARRHERAGRRGADAQQRDAQPGDEVGHGRVVEERVGHRARDDEPHRDRAEQPGQPRPHGATSA